MNSSLRERLDEILPRVTSERFLSSEGIGNEIACYLFDYPATHELEVREHIEWMMGRFETHHKNLRVLHLNLLDVVLDCTSSEYFGQEGGFVKRRFMVLA